MYRRQRLSHRSNNIIIKKFIHILEFSYKTFFFFFFFLISEMGVMQIDHNLGSALQIYPGRLIIPSREAVELDAFFGFTGGPGLGLGLAWKV